LTSGRLRLLAAALSLPVLAACATTRPARHFVPATDAEAREAIAAWQASLVRAASLPASRLLYDARISKGGAPAVPGTLAVTYDGRSVVTASLTGPFGSRIAEYRDGRVSGEDRAALLIQPEAMRAVLAGGAWSGVAPAVEGVDAGQARVAFDAEGARVRVVLDLATRNPVSLEVSGPDGHLFVDYGGAADPWPAQIDAREETAHRRVVLKLLTVERAGAGGEAGR
jgi:hypothetical protein